MDHRVYFTESAEIMYDWGLFQWRGQNNVWLWVYSIEKTKIRYI